MFYYKVQYWDEDICEPQDENGLVAASNYGDAALKVIDYYGHENIVSLTLIEWEDILSREEVTEGFDSIDNF